MRNNKYLDQASARRTSDEREQPSSGYGRRSEKDSLRKQIQHHEMLIAGLRKRLEELPSPTTRTPEQWLGESVYELLESHQETATALEEAGIFTVRDLLQRNREGLLCLPGMGARRIEFIVAALARAGFPVGKTV